MDVVNWRYIRIIYEFDILRERTNYRKKWRWVNRESDKEWGRKNDKV